MADLTRQFLADLSVLADLSAGQRGALLDVAAEVSATSEEWLASYPVVARSPVTAACSLAAAIGMPGLGVPELALMTRWWLWIFGVDDRFDDPGYPDFELESWTAEFTAALHGDSSGANSDLLLAAFGSIHRDLRGYPVFGVLDEPWRRGMADIVQGMHTERRWHVGLTGAAVPSFEEYLKNGITTICVRPYTITACVVAGELAAAAGFGALDPMIRAAARCFRLANDLRSDSRERQEGKLNAVSLLRHKFAADPARPMPDGDDSWDSALEKARAQIQAACADDLSYLERAMRRAPPEIRNLARFLWAHTAFVVDMYEVGDYDTVSAMLTAGLIAI
jgi:hypothetical protein